MRVDPGPGRLGGWTSPDKVKDRQMQKPGRTQATRTNPDETLFFSNVVFLLDPFFIYIF